MKKGVYFQCQDSGPCIFGLYTIKRCLKSYFHLADLQELLQLSKDSSPDDLLLLTPPGSDANSDSELSLPGSPAYEEMGVYLSFLPCLCMFRFIKLVLILVNCHQFSKLSIVKLFKTRLLY